ncbi:MAG: hypothetical protein QOD72_3794 [Acidimicrobiaceae bacterium]|nr:hypothetical protein [Acidimicrobiaceae bacterium]
MASSTFTIPYRAIVQGDRPRPYLVMMVEGINGQSGPVIGIADSGADVTSLPMDYASLMGYTPQTLSPQTMAHAAGTATAYLATEPATIFVPEIPDVKILVTPTFIPGAQHALWGRSDFMAAFTVSFDEARQEFSLTYRVSEPDPSAEDG